MTNYEALLMGHPIYIATKEVQRRKHHKKRINKKWRKRYGVVEINIMPYGQVVTLNGALWMTKQTFHELKNLLAEGDSRESENDVRSATDELAEKCT